MPRQMSEALSPHKNKNVEMLELEKDLKRAIEDAENASVQLTWMTYDMVALRTDPELEALMRKLEEAFQRCTAAVCGYQNREQEEENRPESAYTSVNKM